MDLLRSRARLGVVGLTLVAISSVSGAVLAPAAAAPGQGEYRYWSYWQHKDEGWVFATRGPTATRPGDGAVEGWRFVVSGAQGEAAPAPRSPGDFARICAKTAPAEGVKRVAVVVDYGTQRDAPGGERPPRPRETCVRVPQDATGAEVLASAARARYDKSGLVCSLDGYPRAGCGAPASDGTAQEGTAQRDGAAPEGAAGQSDADTRRPLGLAGGVAIVIALGVTAMLRARRRRS